MPDDFDYRIPPEEMQFTYLETVIACQSAVKFLAGDIDMSSCRSPVFWYSDDIMYSEGEEFVYILGHFTEFVCDIFELFRNSKKAITLSRMSY